MSQQQNIVAGLEHLAQHFVRSVQSQLGIELEYNHVAVKWLNTYIEQIRPNYEPEQVPPNLVQSLGAFLGACIIANYGGRWGHEHESNDWGIALPVQGGDIWVYPFNKVYKHIAAGEEHSVRMFYEAIPNLIDPSRNWGGPQNIELQI